MPEPIEQKISITGGAESKQTLDDVARSGERFGDAIDQSGQDARDAEGKLGSLDNTLGNVNRQFAAMVTSGLGLGAVVQLVTSLIEKLERLQEIQRELSTNATDFAEENRAFAQQIGRSEEAAAIVTTQIAEAGGTTLPLARAIGTTLHIAAGQVQEGGTLFTGENFGIAKELSRVAGVKSFGPEEVSAMITYLQESGQLGSLDAARLGMARFIAASDKSRAETVGEFAQIVLGGGQGLLQQRVAPFDVLTAAVQARQAEGNAANAAQTLRTLEQIAVGAEKGIEPEIQRVASAQGLDAGSLTTAQRVAIIRDIFGGITTQAEQDRIAAMVSPERFLRMLKAFRASTVEATAPAGTAIGEYTADDLERTLAASSGDVDILNRQAEARRTRATFGAGRELFPYIEARIQAETERQVAVAKGLDSGYYAESSTERRMMAAFRNRVKALRDAGIDTSAIEERMDAAELAESWLGTFWFVPGISDVGYPDKDLQAIATGIASAERGQRLNRVRGGNVTVNHIGSAYYDRDPAIQPAPSIDLGQ